MQYLPNINEVIGFREETFNPKAFKRTISEWLLLFKDGVPAISYRYEIIVKADGNFFVQGDQIVILDHVLRVVHTDKISAENCQHVSLRNQNVFKKIDRESFCFLVSNGIPSFPINRFYHEG